MGVMDSDAALSPLDAQTANTRVGSVENRLSDSDRLAKIEAALAAHAAIFAEREKAEQQAQTERQLAAAAVQQALQEAASASAKALEAALKNANELELERVARVRDEVKEVKDASTKLVNERQTAQQKFEENVKERFAQVNEFRGSLDDLGKSMGTRRELEQAVDAQRLSAATLAKEISALRSRIDVGPEDLRALQSKSDESSGKDAGEASRRALRAVSVAIVSAGVAGVAVIVAIVQALH
jgi:chromosome segregation ATPase